jgi:L-aspartate oxidase
LRGEGALLLNPARDRFMSRYHPMAELAPRDVVARAIVQEIAASTTTPAVAYLDMRHLNEAHLHERFPRIYTTCKQYGIDITTDLVPIRPAAHYLMGGIKTDLEGRSTLSGLYAAGETACTGVHGANRLASNSLLEGLVFGARAGEAMRNEQSSTSIQSCTRISKSANSPNAEKIAERLRASMWQNAGVMRNKQGLDDLQKQIAQWKTSLPVGHCRQMIETQNLLVVAELVTRSALAREESRGAHFRTDCPHHDDARFRKHSIESGGQIRFE